MHKLRALAEGNLPCAKFYNIFSASFPAPVSEAGGCAGTASWADGAAISVRAMPDSDGAMTAFAGGMPAFPA